MDKYKKLRASLILAGVFGMAFWLGVYSWAF